MIGHILENRFSLIGDTIPPRHPNGEDEDENENDENGDDKEPPVVREPDEGE